MKEDKETEQEPTAKAEEIPSDFLNDIPLHPPRATIPSRQHDSIKVHIDIEMETDDPEILKELIEIYTRFKNIKQKIRHKHLTEKDI